MMPTSSKAPQIPTLKAIIRKYYLHKNMEEGIPGLIATGLFIMIATSSLPGLLEVSLQISPTDNSLNLK